MDFLSGVLVGGLLAAIVATGREVVLGDRLDRAEAARAALAAALRDVLAELDAWLPARRAGTRVTAARDTLRAHGPQSERPDE